MLLGYLRSRLGIIAVWVLIFAVFTVVSALYRVPLIPAVYSAAVSGFFCLIIFIKDFFSFRKKITALKKTAEEVTITLDNMPEPSGKIEAEYDTIIRSLYESRRSAENEINARYSDMTDYYTMWTHQIKTPIAAMDLILQSAHIAENAELKENLAKIGQYADMALCYARLDSDYTDFLIKEYDLDNIVRQAIRKFSSQFIRKNLKLDYEPLKKKVLTDEKWLLFVIEQVISNAVKYTYTGGVKIYCGDGPVLCVEDTGIGIAPEDLPRIFDKGYTGYNGRTDKKASGIGLYLCKRICGKLGHKISAENSSSGGTLIRINLSSTKIEIE